MQGFQWDLKKASANLLKHSIDFADAVGVFEDDWAMTIKQEIIAGEQRLASIGTDYLGRVVVVVYTYRNSDIRIISARPATKRERIVYEAKR